MEANRIDVERSGVNSCPVDNPTANCAATDRVDKMDGVPACDTRTRILSKRSDVGMDIGTLDGTGL